MSQVPGVRETLVRAGAEPAVAAAIERRVQTGTDDQLVRVDPLQFAAAEGLDEDRTLDGFVYAAKIGSFDMVWDMLCPGCGSVLDEARTLRSINHTEYPCGACRLSTAPNLDDLVEVSFTVSKATRPIAAHDARTQPFWDYFRDHAFSRMLALPAGPAFFETIERLCSGRADLAPGERGAIELPGDTTLVFEPATHGLARMEVSGEPVTQVQELTAIYTSNGVSPAALAVRPGPVRLTVENRTNGRILVAAFRAVAEIGMLFANRVPYLTAKRLLTNQVFRDQFRAEVMDVDQQLRVTSLSVMFTDLKGSTELYDRVGDLSAFDLVRQHFGVLAGVIRTHGGAIVKTIGDAVMATFPTPDRAMAAALEIRRAMDVFNRSNQRDDLIVKIGLHEGPCLAVTLNERVDFFGQTINVAARVQGLAKDSAIFTTESVVRSPPVKRLLADAHLLPVPQKANLRGVRGEVTVYEIP